MEPLGEDWHAWPIHAKVRLKQQLEARRLAAKRTGAASAFAAFGRRYRDDYVAFVHDCFEWRSGQGPAAYQDEILAELPRRKRVAARGPHGLGKTALAAWVVLAFALTREALGLDWKVPATAGAWRQLTKYLWPEIHKWARRLRWDKIGRTPFEARTEMLSLSLKLEHGEAFALASDVADLIEGAHADSLLYLLDESKSIPDPTWDAVEGAFAGAGEDTTAEAYALSISTPGEPTGRFYEIHARKQGYDDWWVRHVTLEDAIAAKRISRTWADTRARQWGAQSAAYQNRVLGEFASSDEDSVIPLSWIERANERWLARMDLVEAGKGTLPALTWLGLDVAMGGKDKTVLARRHDIHVAPLERYDYADTMQTAGVIVGVLRANARARALVDIIGVGAGVFHRAREQRGGQVLAFNAAEKTEGKDRSGELGFADVRSEAWWRLREQLDPEFEPTLELPPDDQLTGDLTAPKWWIVSDGKIRVESKDDLRDPKRLGRSTDDGDAVVQACFGRSAVYAYDTAKGSSGRKRGEDEPPDDDRGGRGGRFGRGAW